MIEVRVSPRASQNRILRDDSGIRVYVTAAPTDGEANEAVQALLAKQLKISKSSVQLVRGQTSRIKCFDVEGLSLEEIHQRIG